MRVFRLINGSPTEGSLSQMIPNCTNPELLTLSEIAAAGILTLPDPAPAAEGKRWDPAVPTLVDGVLTGGWVLVDLPPPPVVPDWHGFLDALNRPDPTTPGLFDALLEADEPKAWQSYNHCLSGLRGELMPEDLQTLSYLYAQLKSKISAPLGEALDQAILEHHIPIA